MFIILLYMQKTLLIIKIGPQLRKQIDKRLKPGIL